MENKKFLEEIVGKKINFLIGAGASSTWLSTLKMKQSGKSIEDLYTECSDEDKRLILMALFFNKSVKAGLVISNIENEDNELIKTVKNYKTFIENAVNIANMGGFEQPKRINIFTTNYDTFFENAFDTLAITNPLVKFNDGSSGFFTRILSYKNYYFNYIHSGSSDYFRREIPSINLYKIHGSLTWKKYDQYIISDFSKGRLENLESIGRDINNLTFQSKNINDLGNELNNSDDPLQILNIISLTTKEKKDLKKFGEKYDDLLIVNPTKKKFSETVFENYYYQMLRAFSNELEKKETVLIVFGFSFKDEHIMDIIHRAQYNPELKIFIIPYSKRDIEFIKCKMSKFKNVEFVTKYDSKRDFVNGDFDVFNSFLSGEDDD